MRLLGLTWRLLFWGDLGDACLGCLLLLRSDHTPAKKLRRACCARHSVRSIVREMALDYYDILGVPRNAGDIQVKRAFRQKALLYHPDKNSAESSPEEFSRVCEAYDVLSDLEKKSFYDLYGENALKNGISDGAGGKKGGTYRFEESSDPQRVFTHFFGTNNPYQAFEAISEDFEKMTTYEKPQKGKKKLCTVELSLEEIYNGCVKRVTFTKKCTSESGMVEKQDRELVIDVKPGMPDGTMFIFDREGNVSPGVIPGPVVFILKSLPHPRFVRNGSDLVHKATIPLYHGLAGTSVEVEMLENRKVMVPFTDVITPGYKHIVPNEGMPKPSGGKGDLIIETELLFPVFFSETQKMLLKAAFFLPSKLSSAQLQGVKAFEATFKSQVKGWETGFPMKPLLASSAESNR